MDFLKIFKLFKRSVFTHKSPQFILDENTSSIQAETGAPSLRSCPKCKVKFSFLDPLKCHMKVK